MGSVFFYSVAGEGLSSTLVSTFRGCFSKFRFSALSNDFPELANILEGALSENQIGLPERPPSEIDVMSVASGGSRGSRGSRRS